MFSVKFFDNTNISYGLQNPDISLVELTPTDNDPEFVDKGPGYHFRTTYNRTVLLRQEQLPQVPGQTASTDPSAQPGDRPWLCFFNNTSIEGFVYAHQRSDLSNQSVSIAINGSGIFESADIPYFPYELKLVEERLSNSTPPYCQPQLVHNGTLVPSNEGIYSLTINERFMRPVDKRKSKFIRRERIKTQQLAVGNSCQCQWMFQ